MPLYSWPNESLLEHSLAALDYVKERFTKELAVMVKLAELYQGRPSSYGVKLLLLAVGLHDIGKALRAYQESVRRYYAGAVSKPSFYCHEFYSAYIYYHLAVRLLKPKGADRLLTLAGAQAIILGHHSMQRMDRCMRRLGVLDLDDLDGTALIITTVAERSGLSLNHGEVKRALNKLVLRDDVKNFAGKILGLGIGRADPKALQDIYRAYTAYKLALILVAPLLIADNESVRRLGRRQVV